MTGTTLDSTWTLFVDLGLADGSTQLPGLRDGHWSVSQYCSFALELAELKFTRASSDGLEGPGGWRLPYRKTDISAADSILLLPQAPDQAGETEPAS